MTDFWIEDVPVWKRLVILAPFLVAGFFIVFDACAWLTETGPWMGPAP